jgi:NhaA family Na+:H+ antiporter
MTDPATRRDDHHRRAPGTVPRISTFLIDHFLLLPLGAIIALVWVNVAPESYVGFTFAIAFAVNDIGMVFFFAVMMKEIVEATAPGGVLHSWRKVLLPVATSIPAAVLPALLHVAVVNALDEPRLRNAWPVTLATDIAVGYFVARMVFGRHPAIPFLLLLGLVSDALGFAVLALFNRDGPAHVAGLLLVIPAMLIAWVLRRARITSIWPYLLLAGGPAWLALWWSGLNPALALVPIIPFLPHAPRDPGLFVDASPNARDTLSRFEIWARYPAQLGLFFFGLVNAGVPFGALEEGTWGLPIAVIFGKPLGVLVGAGVATVLGLHLPNRIGWRELIVVGFCAGIGFSVGLFLATNLLPPGQLRSEVSMGALLSLAAAPIAIGSARVLHVGRFGLHSEDRRSTDITQRDSADKQHHRDR